MILIPPPGPAKRRFLVAKSNLASRLTTAGVAIPVLTWLMYLGPNWGWCAVVTAGVWLAGWEALGMSHPGDAVSRFIGATQGAALALGAYLFTQDARVLITLLLISIVIGLLVPLWRLGEIHTAALRIFGGIAGPPYAALLIAIALLKRDQGEDGPGYVMMTLMFAWLADTGGYFAGRFLGKHKLYPSVSPNKTWEGFWGAVAGALVAACLAHFIYLRSIPLTHALGLALVSGVLGQLGDLAESLLKRSTSIKDSGGWLPGHGGMLDRVDALLVVGPLVWLYTVWF
jgi:phosphatidate cytidylyltransferase